MNARTLEAIQRAVDEDASVEQKVTGAQACRTILTALEAEPRKPLALPSGPAPQSLAGINPDHALDLLVARLRASLPAEDAARAEGSTPGDVGLKFALVRPPPRPPRRKR